MRYNWKAIIIKIHPITGKPRIEERREKINLRKTINGKQS